jgi:hypothetical protein
MGCCESTASDEVSSLATPNTTATSSYFTPIEMMLLQMLMTKLPNHCRQTIIDIPPRKVLNALQHHINAQHHILRKEYPLAILCESKAISEFQALIPNHQDHFIFVDLYNTMIKSLANSGLFQASLGACQIVLNILLRDTPTDYKAINITYSFLYQIYERRQAWRAAFICMTKAIETARLCHSPNQEGICSLEDRLEQLK